MLGMDDMGMTQLVEAKGLIRNGRLRPAIAPLREAVDIFANAGDAAWEWHAKASCLLGYCHYHLHSPREAVAALEGPFPRMAAQATPLALAYIALLASATLETEAPASCVALAAHLPTPPSPPPASIHITLLRALLSRDPSLAHRAFDAAASSLAATREAAFHRALALLVEGLLGVPSEDPATIRAAIAAYSRALLLLHDAYGESSFGGAEVEPELHPAVDLYSSLLQASAQARLALLRIQPTTSAAEGDGERPPDPESLAAELLSGALKLNRVVCPEDRNNRKAEALLGQLYDLYVTLGMYVQGSGIYNTLLRCKEAAHGPQSPEAVALMRQHHRFLLSVDAKGEAKALGEHLAALERSDG